MKVWNRIVTPFIRKKDGARFWNAVLDERIAKANQKGPRET